MFSPIREESVDRGVLIVDDEIIETKTLSFSKGLLSMQKLKTYTINPHSKRVVQVAMIPQSGCFYPVELIFKRID